MSVRVSRSLFSLRRYLLFFALVSFLVTCCFLLFFRELQASLGEEWGAEALRHAAKITFANVLFLSFLCALIDGIRRKVTGTTSSPMPSSLPAQADISGWTWRKRALGPW